MKQGKLVMDGNDTQFTQITISLFFCLTNLEYVCLRNVYFYLFFLVCHRWTLMMTLMKSTSITFKTQCKWYAYIFSVRFDVLSVID